MIEQLNRFFRLQNKIVDRLQLGGKYEKYRLHSLINDHWQDGGTVVYFAYSASAFSTKPDQSQPNSLKYSERLDRDKYVLFVTDEGLLMFDRENSMGQMTL